MITDRLLLERGARPITVGIVGTGAIGRGLTRQITRVTPGLRVAAVSGRRLEAALETFAVAGIEQPVVVTEVGELEEAVADGRPAVTDNPGLLCRADGIDVIVELTGAVEFGAGVAVEAIANRKHVVTTAELNATLGPVLKRRADEAVVVFTDIDGDQPGALLQLCRFARTVGCAPVLAGNIKSLQDPYRTPSTQEGFAREHGLSPEMATSFADGSKISFEMAVVANATGFRVTKLGMCGYRCRSVTEAAELFSLDELLDGGRVDYILGAQPAPGVFVLGYQDDQVERKYLRLHKMGDGPLYTFYTPYHLGHFEVPVTIARAAAYGEAAVAPLAGPVVEVATTAKRDLAAGEIVDGIGHYMTYGQCENADRARTDGLLPLGVAEGCRLVRDVPQDQLLTYADVELPPSRLVDALRREQDELFATADVGEAASAAPST
jgi:predicted homoserine dehydrogenase-like protein